MEQEAYIQRRFKEIGYNFEEIVKEEYVRPEVTEERRTWNDHGRDLQENQIEG